jgi:O-antigen ligase
MTRVPLAGYVAILWSVATAVDILAPPEVGVSSLKFAPAEILLWMALGSIAFLRRDIRRALNLVAYRTESIVIAVFLGAIVGGIAIGTDHGASLHSATLAMRYMLFYAAFWPALVAVIAARRQLINLVTGGVILVVSLQLAQVIAGPSRHLFLIAPSDVNTSLTQDGTGFLRVRPPGLTAVYLVAAFALARVIWGPARGRKLGWIIVIVSMTGVVLSLNRNMLLGLLFGLSAAALVAKDRHRIVTLAAGLTVVLACFVLLAPGTSLWSNTVVSRFSSLSNYSALQTQTLNDRFYENGIALQRIRAHPIGGLGWGPTYGAVLTSYDDGFLLTRPRTFMHDQYLWIWMRAGLVGLLAMLTMLAIGIYAGARWCRTRARNADGWLGAGVVVSLVAIAASSNVAIYLTSPDSIVPLVGVLALAAWMRFELTDPG